MIEVPDRRDPPHQADELAMLTAFLTYQRQTFAIKCAGLSTEQLRTKAVPPSDLSLLGLARHLSDVERSWFRFVFDGEDIPPRWDPQARPEVEFAVEDADPDEAFAAWYEECARADEIVAAAGSLDDTGSYQDQVYSLRYILTHLIEEYARHNGHADLLRERLDGRTGD